MVLFGRFIKLAVMMGLMTQLMMSAYMTSMMMARAELQSAQNNFYAAISLNKTKVNKGYSLCLSADSSDTGLEDCEVCKALIGFGFYTLAALPSLLPHDTAHKIIRPLSVAFIGQNRLYHRYIRGPPTQA